MTPILVDLQTAREHLRVDDTVEDYIIQNFIISASSIVTDYLKVVPDWWDTSPLEIPGVVRSATLLVLGELYLNRESSTADVLSPAVYALLHRLRDPAMA